MVEKLKEQLSVWDRLKQAEKPIVLYGMGDGADKILKIFEQRKIPLAGVFASDAYVRGHSFAGHIVKTFSQIQEDFSDFIIVLAFAAFRDPLLGRMYELDAQYEFYAPDVPVCVEDDTVFDLDYIRQYEAQWDTVYSLLADDLSRRTLLSVLNYKISGKISYLKEIESPQEERYRDIIKPDGGEDYVDLGAYIGDTIQEFLDAVNGQYHSITAFEPDRKNYNKLVKMIEKQGLQRVNACNIGSYEMQAELPFSNRAGRNSTLHTGEGVLTPVDSVDHILNGNRASIIKFDVEGAEESSLRGCRETIQKFHPKLMLSAYHKNSDLFLLPLLVQEICPDYQFYLRHHPYVPAWETNFYLVPKKEKS